MSDWKCQTNWGFDICLTFSWSDISLTIWNFVENLWDSLRYFAWYLNVRLEMSDQLGVWHLSDIRMVWHQSDNLKLWWNVSRICQIFLRKCQTNWPILWPKWNSIEKMGSLSSVNTRQYYQHWNFISLNSFKGIIVVSILTKYQRYKAMWTFICIM